MIKNLDRGKFLFVFHFPEVEIEDIKDKTINEETGKVEEISTTSKVFSYLKTVPISIPFDEGLYNSIINSAGVGISFENKISKNFFQTRLDSKVLDMNITISQSSSLLPLFVALIGRCAEYINQDDNKLRSTFSPPYKVGVYSTDIIAESLCFTSVDYSINAENNTFDFNMSFEYVNSDEFNTSIGA